MSSQKSEGRMFTFVQYDINCRGVTETARAHLMKDRGRTKHEAKSGWVSRNQSSPLRWMQPKEDNHRQDSDAPNTKTSESGELDETAKPQISLYTAVIDFHGDSVTVSPFVKKPRLESPRSRSGTKSGRKKNLHFHDNSSEGGSSDKNHGRSPKKGNRPGASTLSNSPFLDADSVRSNASIFDVGRSGSHQKRTSMEGRSEFGLTLLEGLRVGTFPRRPIEQNQHFGLNGASQRKILQALQDPVEGPPIDLTPIDRNLIRYFAVNAVPMLGLDVYPEVVQQHDPVLQLFLPFAISSRWCFETMILFFSANHCRGRELAPEIGLLDTENHHLASQQNFMLARTRERISALANYRDSSDDDVVAFLFLALSEYCAGNRQIGLMHFKAWKEYCGVRRVLGIRPCGLPCKMVVWWCVSIICEEDVSLDGIIDPTTRERIQEDPGKLFRYFETMREVQYVEGTDLFRSELFNRRITC